MLVRVGTRGQQLEDLKFKTLLALSPDKLLNERADPDVQLHMTKEARASIVPSPENFAESVVLGALPSLFWAAGCLVGFTQGTLLASVTILCGVRVSWH
jgi:hypothetical protein